MPPRLKKPPPVVAAGAPTPGLPGWLKVRLNGCAVLGAVDVLGGAEKVRDPRDPELRSAADTGIGRRDGHDQRQRQRQDDRDRPYNSARALREIHLCFP